MTCDAIDDANAILIHRDVMTVFAFHDAYHLFVILILKLNGMPFQSLDDLPCGRVLGGAILLAIGCIWQGQFAGPARFAPKRAYPDRKFQIAFLELDPYPGSDFGDEHHALIRIPAVGDAGHGPAGDDAIAQHARNPQFQSAELFRVGIVHH